MLGRIEFNAERFSHLVPKNGKKSSKKKYNKIYDWLSDEMLNAGIQHKIIDLDKDASGKKTGTQYGKTILVVMRRRYQIVCGYFPVQPQSGPASGVWGLEVFKERGIWDRYLHRHKLNLKDELVQQIMALMGKHQFSDVRFVPEKQMKSL